MNHLHLKNVVLLIVILAIAVAAFGGIEGTDGWTWDDAAANAPSLSA